MKTAQFQISSIENKFLAVFAKLLFAILLISPIHAEDLTQVPEPQLRQRMSAGNMEALTEIAWRCLDGHILPFDDQFIFESFKRASDAGVARAHNGLGSCYFRGIQVRINLPEALRLFQMAADAKDPEGIYNLAAAYYDGRGVPADREKAIALFKESAGLGCDWAEVFLVWLKLDEKNSAPAVVEASLARLVELAEVKGSVAAAYRLGVYFKGDPSVKRTANLPLARKYFEIAAKKDSARAMSELSEMAAAQEPGGKPPSRREAQEWSRQAARRNHPSSMMEVGLSMMRNSNVREKDIDWYDYLIRSERAGYSPAKVALGQVNYHAPGYTYRDLDWSESVHYFQQYFDGRLRRAEDDPNIDTCLHFLCKMLYEGGHGLNRDFPRCLSVAQPFLGKNQYATAYSGLTLLHPDSPMGTSRAHYVRGYACLLSARKLGYLISDEALFEVRSRHSMTRQEARQAKNLSEKGFPNPSTPLLP